MAMLIPPIHIAITPPYLLRLPAIADMMLAFEACFHYYVVR